MLEPLKHSKNYPSSLYLVKIIIFYKKIKVLHVRTT
jgi:hypothetical protein